MDFSISPPPAECEVLVVGAGVAGATAAHALAMSGVRSVCVIDSGRVGVGYSIAPEGSGIEGALVYPHALYSGSAVMSYPTSTIKMMVTAYPSSSAEFISHHGFEGARRYINLATRGIELQKELAIEVLPDPSEQLTCLGSLYVAGGPAGIAELKEEYETLVSLGCEGIELWDKDKLATMDGVTTVGFDLGIYFPNDAVINSSEYSKGLLRKCVSMGAVSVHESCPRAVSVTTAASDHALCVLADGSQIRSKYIVVATGGLFLGSPDLAGILQPCFSYLVSVPEPEASNRQDLLRHGVNMFSWGFTHDWCLTKGHYRCSGEDHFSALKDPKWEERCRNLAYWTAEKYPYLLNGKGLEDLKYDTKYGVYSETPDKAPLVGTTNDASRVCYLVGCNAWGQASLSYAGHLVPGILGYTELTAEQKDSLSLLTIRRFSLLPSVLSGL